MHKHFSQAKTEINKNKFLTSQKLEQTNAYRPAPEKNNGRKKKKEWDEEDEEKEDRRRKG